ncbi:tetratricopeptide repeat protein [Planotetraspora kaengkrachanensis]
MVNLALLIEDGDREEAIRLLHRAAEVGDTVEPHYNLGVFLEEDGRLEEAERWYRDAAERCPHSARGSRTRGARPFRELLPCHGGDHRNQWWENRDHRTLAGQGVYGGATPQPQRGTGALVGGVAPGAEFCTARRVPHSM